MLKGVVRISNLEDAQEPIADVVMRVKAEYLRRAYKVPSWTDPDDFGQIARMSGKLLKGGEEDVNAVAKTILHDWQRGRIPWFTAPPSLPDGPSQTIVNVTENATDAIEKTPPAPAIWTKAEATMKQVHLRMPQAHGLFDEEDRHDQEYATEDEDEPASGDEGGEEEEDEEVATTRYKVKRKREELSGDDEEDSDEEDDENAATEHGENSESEDVDINDELVGDGVDAETLKKFASDDEDSGGGDDSDSDSDGYGPDGLSFDQVLAEMKGEVKEKPSGVKSSTKSRVDKEEECAERTGAAGSAKNLDTVNFMAGKKPARRKGRK